MTNPSMEISLHQVTKIVVEPYITEDEEGKYPTLQKWKRVHFFNEDELLLIIKVEAYYNCDAISVEVFDKREDVKVVESRHFQGGADRDPG